MTTYVERLIDRDDVRFEREEWKLTAEELTQVESRDIQGGVVVAVRDDTGAVLLIRNEWMDGYGLPGGGVEPDETWEEAAVREVEEETGVSIELVRPWQVREQLYKYDGERYDGDYTVFYLARPIAGSSIVNDPGVGSEQIDDVRWFSTVPSNTFQPELLSTLLDDRHSSLADRLNSQ